MTTPQDPTRSPQTETHPPVEVIVRLGTLEALRAAIEQNLRDQSLYVVTRDVIAVGTPVVVTYRVSEAAEERLRLRGDVTMVITEQESEIRGYPAGFGVRYLPLRRRDRLKIDAYLLALVQRAWRPEESYVLDMIQRANVAELLTVLGLEEPVTAQQLKDSYERWKSVFQPTVVAETLDPRWHDGFAKLYHRMAKSFGRFAAQLEADKSRSFASLAGEVVAVESTSRSLDESTSVDGEGSSLDRQTSVDRESASLDQPAGSTPSAAGSNETSRGATTTRTAPAPSAQPSPEERSKASAEATKTTGESEPKTDDGASTKADEATVPSIPTVEEIRKARGRRGAAGRTMTGQFPRLTPDILSVPNANGVESPASSGATTDSNDDSEETPATRVQFWLDRGTSTTVAQTTAKTPEAKLEERARRHLDPRRTMSGFDKSLLTPKNVDESAVIVDEPTTLDRELDDGYGTFRRPLRTPSREQTNPWADLKQRNRATNGTGEAVTSAAPPAARGYEAAATIPEMHAADFIDAANAASSTRATGDGGAADEPTGTPATAPERDAPSEGPGAGAPPRAVDATPIIPESVEFEVSDDEEPLQLERTSVEPRIEPRIEQPIEPAAVERLETQDIMVDLHAKASWHNHEGLDLEIDEELDPEELPLPDPMPVTRLESPPRDSELPPAFWQFYGQINELSYYELLRVEPNTDKRAIQEAYHAASAALHPDLHRSGRTPDQAAVELVYRRMTEAYDVLKNAEKRRHYDHLLQVGRQYLRMPADAIWGEPAEARPELDASLDAIEQLIGQRKIAEAEAAIRDVLRRDPLNRRARELLQTLNKRKRAQMRSKR
ncbi:MAG: DnaJ domain-containing protein [Myxococcales bacterium]|nr:DnaJ domain-containing protein [Myxococcales bacterium]